MLISDLSQLVGFRLEACRFSRGSYTLEFDGRIGDHHASVSIGTSYHLSSGLRPLRDLEQRVSEAVWPLLEQIVTDVCISDSEERSQVAFRFSDGELVVWQEKPADDNLLIVRDRNGPGWGAFL